jgi:hypothetical protein
MTFSAFENIGTIPVKPEKAKDISLAAKASGVARLAVTTGGTPN